MADTLLQLLQRIYDADIAEQTAQAIRERLGSASTPRPLDGTRFSERDVMLITYGDTLQAASEPPLQTLGHFAQERLGKLFSHIHILPFYPYSSDDGFSVTDFYAVNPALGTWADVHALANDFALMFDAVFNHMSAQSEWFEKFLAAEPGYAELFVTADPATDLSGVTRPRTSPLLTAFDRPTGETAHVWTTFSADQVDLNYAAPETLLRMLDVLLFYVEQGANTIRLDAIAYLWKQPGTPSIHLPEAHTIIQLMRAVLDIAAPETVLITETNVPHTENITYFGDGHNEAQMVYNFTLPPILFHTMLSGDCTRLQSWIGTLQTPSPQTTFFNFTASHDGIGMRPVEGILSAGEISAMIDHVTAVGGRVSYKANADGSQSPYELNVSYLDAVTDPSEPLAMQARRFLITQAIAMGLAGIPAVYIHSLLGSRSDIAGMQAAGYNRRINRARLNVKDVRSALAKPGSLQRLVFDGFEQLLTVRRSHPAFHPNSGQTLIDTGTSGVLGICRTSAEGDVLTALYNVTGRPQTAHTRTNQPQKDLLTGEIIQQTPARLTPYQVRWLVPA